MTANVSVVIPTYNRADLLGKAIDSVLAQTYPDFELIVADDGSTDHTAALVQRYLEPTHPFHHRIRYFYQTNQGKSVALNNALLKARGEWIAFLDSDDAWLPEKLEWQFRAIANFPECGACFTDCQFVKNPNAEDTTTFRIFGKQFDQTLGKLPNSAKVFLQSPCASIITLVCRADVIRNAGGFDSRLRFTEDYDLMFRLALLTDYCYVNLPLAIADRSLATNRHTGPSAIWDKVEFRIHCEQYRYEKWLNISQSLPSDLRAIIIKRLRAAHSSLANWHLENGDYEKARQAIARAIKYQLTPNLVAKWILTRFSPRLMKGIVLKRGGFDTDRF